jgi:hypothetical protein
VERARGLALLGIGAAAVVTDIVVWIARAGN